MEFLEGFAWAVPSAFSDAIDQCRFERGDCLYPSPNAYESAWIDAQRQMGTWAQIRYPERMSGSSTAGTESILEVNWTSEVGLSLYQNGRVVGKVVTTQGRVYTLLWRGDLVVLDEGHPEPDVPHRAKVVLKHMETALPGIRERSAGRLTFAMPFDRVNRTSREKLSRLEAGLSDHLVRPPLFLRPSDVGLLDSDRVAPTLTLACFSVDRMNANELEDSVKAVFYQPGKNVNVDRFRISAHGAVV